MSKRPRPISDDEGLFKKAAPDKPQNNEERDPKGRTLTNKRKFPRRKGDRYPNE